MRKLIVLAILMTTAAANMSADGEEPKFKAVAFYSTNVEKPHADFATDALAFYGKLAQEKSFVLDSTTDWSNVNAKYLANYNVVIWLNNSVFRPDQRKAFEDYMEHGGAWLAASTSPATTTRTLTGRGL